MKRKGEKMTEETIITEKKKKGRRSKYEILIDELKKISKDFDAERKEKYDKIIKFFELENVSYKENIKASQTARLEMGRIKKLSNEELLKKIKALQDELSSRKLQNTK